MLANSSREVENSEIMALGAELDDAFVAGIVPVLKEPDTLVLLHEQAEETDRAMHFAHSALVGSVANVINYDQTVVGAVNIGAIVYETLGANVSQRVPLEFASDVIALREKDPNFSLHIVEQMKEEWAQLVASYPFLAGALRELCEVHILDFGQTGEYALGAAALMRASHCDISALWQLEQEQTGASLNLDELMDLS